MVHPIALALTVGIGIGAVIFSVFWNTINRHTPIRDVRHRPRARPFNYEPESPNMCSICLEEVDDNLCARLDCGHRFHRGCITEHFRHNDRFCPNCRGPTLYRAE